MRQLAPDTWELATGSYDFHIRLEDGRFCIDVFASDVTDADAAHVDELEADTLDEARQLCEQYSRAH